MTLDFKRILITGGAGFIGSHVVDHFCAVFPASEIIVLDKMTYAADFRHIEGPLGQGRVQLIVGDICDYNLCRGLVANCELVIHCAAESHVDRSFHSSVLFTQTNVLGTHTMMEACRTAGVPRIIHVSTDEVYGEVLTGTCDEDCSLNPTNPYSASKAAAEMVVNGYTHSFKLPVIMLRANNVYGVRQFPEKLIPRCCLSLARGDKIPLHGDGRNERHYLAAQDLAVALEILARRGVIHEVYNVGSMEHYANSEIARLICDAFGKSFDENVVFIPDRPFNDRRYAISWDKISSLGWAPQRRLAQDIPQVAAWYRENADRLYKLMKRTDSL